MSQGDYISKKKIISQILNQNKLPPILGSSLYTECMSYSGTLGLCTTTGNRLFITNINTNTRPNRVENISPLYSNVMPYVKHKKEVGCSRCGDKLDN